MLGGRLRLNENVISSKIKGKDKTQDAEKGFRKTNKPKRAVRVAESKSGSSEALVLFSGRSPPTSPTPFSFYNSFIEI